VHEGVEVNRIPCSKKPLDPAPLNRQIGRILQQNQRAAARFAIAIISLSY
jgi:hypothetical protein